MKKFIVAFLVILVAFVIVLTVISRRYDKSLIEQIPIPEQLDDVIEELDRNYERYLLEERCFDTKGGMWNGVECIVPAPGEKG